ncbi:hypothetical protein F4801DRAFT_542890 [Xylaria longipes]|nr:hypothetical protein F4801DRAFT_542890 [Xylaria longipes]
MQDIEYSVTSETSIRLRVEHKPASSNQNGVQSSPPALTQATGAIQKTKESSQRPVVNSPPKNQENSRKTRTRLSESDVDSDEAIIATCRKSGGGQPSVAEHSQSNANKKRRRAEIKTVNIRDVKNTFIFEYPHKSSLLWIVRCSSCDFQPKRNPLTSWHNATLHWKSKGHQEITIQEILEDHLIQGMYVYPNRNLMILLILISWIFSSLTCHFWMYSHR